MESRFNHSVIETLLFVIPNKNRTGGDAVIDNRRVVLEAIPCKFISHSVKSLTDAHI